MLHRVIAKKAANCGACAEYPCATVTGFHAACPEAKANLEALKQTLKK